MPEEQPLQNRVRAHRMAHGWSQESLASRVGVSRAGISAIETGRFAPSAVTALTLAAVFGCRVEDVFSLETEKAGQPNWAWQPPQDPCRYWQGTVAGRKLLYPVEPTNLGVVPHDGVLEQGVLRGRSCTVPDDTLVVACCDPAVGLLAAELQRTQGVRLLALQRPSRAALALVARGLIHVAGVHLGGGRHQSHNAVAARGELHRGFTLLRVARWQEGLAASRDMRIKSVHAALQAKMRWVGRESGSAVRELLDELLADRSVPRRLAYSHRGVAEAVRCGWADVGVCLRLASEEAGLDFVDLRQEDYDLCYPAEYEGDPRVQALVEAVRSASYRRALADLPGYDTAETGELQRVP
ncbi:MAG: substrate-binding domain-containing protein [Thermoguttaceae bacterium]|jgi:molybdate-binding protein/DNA-binding XRE family transcriptional regulator